MRIGIMGTPLSSGNRGVLALAESLVRLCREAAPGAEVTMFGSGAGGTVVLRPEGEPLAVTLVGWRLSLRGGFRHHLAWVACAALLYRLVPIAGVRRRLARATPWISALEQMDFVGDVRGGDSFSDIYGLRRYVIATISVWTVLCVKGTLVQFPQTYGPYATHTARIIARYLLRHSSTVVARDTRSQKVAQDLVRGKRDILLSPDVAFALHVRGPASLETDPPCAPSAHEAESSKIADRRSAPNSDLRATNISAPPGALSHPRTSISDPPHLSAPSVSDIPSGTIGLNVNGLMYHGGYTRQNQFGLKMSYPDFLQRLLEALLGSTAAEVLLVPHTYAPAGNLESDNECCHLLRERVAPELRSRVRIVTGDYDCHEIKSVIGCCDFFIGSRMHSCIGALSQGVPCVGVAYSMKFVGVFESVDMGDWVVDARSHNETEAVDRILSLYGHRDAARPRLAAAVTRAQTRLREVFAGIVADGHRGSRQ